MREVVRRAKRGVPVLGVCNGFQILIESGILPGALMRNSSIKYVCKDIHLIVSAIDSVFTSNFRLGEVVRMPIAHREGNYFAEQRILDRLQGENRIAFQYSDPNGNLTANSNPNGSQKNIAGIFNDQRNVLGMMPHPERLFESVLGGMDGEKFFKGLFRAIS